MRNGVKSEMKRKQFVKLTETKWRHEARHDMREVTFLTVPGGDMDVSLRLSKRNERRSSGRSKDTTLQMDCMTRHPTTMLLRMMEGREMSSP